jgi:hypothetical protein
MAVVVLRLEAVGAHGLYLRHLLKINTEFAASSLVTLMMYVTT